MGRKSKGTTGIDQKDLEYLGGYQTHWYWPKNGIETVGYLSLKREREYLYRRASENKKSVMESQCNEWCMNCFAYYSIAFHLHDEKSDVSVPISIAV